MNHVHYDLPALEAQMRHQVAEAEAEIEVMIGKSNISPEMVSALRAQRMFDEARIQFNLAMMQITNDGGRRVLVLAAAGHTLGQLWADLLKSTTGAGERGIINASVRQPMDDAIGPDAATKTFAVVLQPMQGGTA
jgi:hypothetical protein